MSSMSSMSSKNSKNSKNSDKKFILNKNVQINQDDQNDQNDQNKQDNKFEQDNQTDFTQIKSMDGYDCIGPCYPPNTVYYNPLTMTYIKADVPTCPIKTTEITLENGQKTKIYADECDAKFINKGYTYFDMFNDSVKIATSPNNFLKEIYQIKDIYGVVMFLNSSYDTIPLYSQRRLLKAIYEVYYKFVEFPKILFIKKINQILIKVYKLKNLPDDKKLMNDLDNYFKSNPNPNLTPENFYNYFVDKYS